MFCDEFFLANSHAEIKKLKTSNIIINPIINVLTILYENKTNEDIGTILNSYTNIMISDY